MRVGQLDRPLRVSGDRKCWRDPTGHVRFTEPDEVDSVDVGWTSAYGGVDEVARQRLGNPVEQYRKEQGELNPECLVPRAALPKRFNLGVAQQSAMGMRVAGVAPLARVELRNLHPREPVWAFNLSEERPRLFMQLPDEAGVELEPEIRTVLIEPELNRICVTWVGEHQVPAPVGPGKAAKIRFAARWSR